MITDKQINQIKRLVNNKMYNDEPSCRVLIVRNEYNTSTLALKFVTNSKIWEKFALLDYNPDLTFHEMADLIVDAIKQTDRYKKLKLEEFLNG